MNVRALLRSSAVAATALFLAATAIHAQSAQLFSVQASGLLANIKDEGEDKLVGGFGVEAMVRVTPSVWSFGLGYQRTAHVIDAFTSGDRAATLLLTGFFFEPRYAFDIGSERFAPYLAGRVARLRALVTVSGQDFTNNGTAYGAGAGVLIRWTSRVNADIGAAFTQNKFEGSFTGYVAKAGLSLGLGSR